jgi:hypothetical protein
MAATIILTVGVSVIALSEKFGFTSMFESGGCLTAATSNEADPALFSTSFHSTGMTNGVNPGPLVGSGLNASVAKPTSDANGDPVTDGTPVNH